MIVSEILTMIKNSLEDDNVYRTDAFLLARLNDGYKLISLLALFDERRSSVDIEGTRNMFAMPKSDDDVCIAPIYIAEANNGQRVHPCRLHEFEYYATQWEGIVDDEKAKYYTLFSPYNYTHAAIAVCPIDEIGSAQYNIVGAFVPSTLVATDNARLSEAHVMVLVSYTRFCAFISEPGRVEDMTEEYKKFIEELEKFVVSLKSRFPGSRDHTPYPPEFVYDNVTEQQRKVAAPKEQESQNA